MGSVGYNIKLLKSKSDHFYNLQLFEKLFEGLQNKIEKELLHSMQYERNRMEVKQILDIMLFGSDGKCFTIKGDRIVFWFHDEYMLLTPHFFMMGLYLFGDDVFKKHHLKIEPGQKNALKEWLCCDHSSPILQTEQFDVELIGGEENHFVIDILNARSITSDTTSSELVIPTGDLQNWLRSILDASLCHCELCQQHSPFLKKRKKISKNFIKQLENLVMNQLIAQLK